MRRSVPAAASVFASALLALSASAQLQVMPGGDLQAAVDAAPDGGWVLIHGGRYSAPLTIQGKSLALVGAAPWEIQCGGRGAYAYSALFGGWSYSPQASCIEAQGSGSEWLIVHNARLGGANNTSSGSWETGSPMRIEGYLNVWVVDTLAEGFATSSGDGRPGSPGIDFRQPGGFLLLERSAVIGGEAASAWGLTSWTATVAPAGISAPGATVQTLAAYVRGGENEMLRIESPWRAPASWRPSPHPCPCPSLGLTDGLGGPGIVSQGLLTPQYAIIEGGRGAKVILWIWTTLDLLIVDWGYRPSGVAWVQG